MRSPLALVCVAMFCLPNLVAGQDWAKQRLENSPRHMEWVKVKHGQREVSSFIVYPEVKQKATSVLVIHEIFGLTDWVRGVADQLAEAGYIAIAPDLLSGAAPGGGGTAELKTGDAARKAIASLPPDQVTADLKAALVYLKSLPAASGRVTVAGFCWGGGQTMRFATNSTELSAAFVFYGSVPLTQADVGRIACPIYGFYGGNDARINTTIPGTTKLMESGRKTYEPVIFEGAGHGFMRAGEAPDAKQPDKKAREQAWRRWKDLLGKL